MFSTLSNFIKKYVPKNLLTRFALIIILPTIIGQIIALQLFYHRHCYHVSNYTSKVITKEIARLIEKTDNAKKLDITDHEKQYLNLAYTIYEKDYLPNIKEKKLTPELRMFKNHLSCKSNYDINISLSTNRKKIQLLVKLQNHPYILFINLPTKILINPSAFVFALWFIFSGIVILVISIIFTKNQIKSILDLSKAIENYGRNGNIGKFNPSGATEIKSAGSAFLKMKKRIEKQKVKRTETLAMISHDLKTPLTRMKLVVEMMKKNDEQEELSFDIETMEQMINSYLNFARGEGSEKFITIRLNEWLFDYIQQNWSGKIKYNFIELKESIKIKPLSFSRALSNIFNNALTYSSKVEISIVNRLNDVCINFEDNGPGIKDNEKKLVFKSFYRGDKSRSLENSSNVGLGLAITKEIINGHFGTISLHDSENLGGLLVMISIPKV